MVGSAHIVPGNEERIWLWSGERKRVKDLGVGAVQSWDTLLLYPVAACVTGRGYLESIVGEARGSELSHGAWGGASAASIEEEENQASLVFLESKRRHSSKSIMECVP